MKLLLLLAPLAVFPLVSCTASSAQGHDHADPFANIGSLVAVLTPTKGSTAMGKVTFTQRDGKVRVVADLTGLEPNGAHAIHVHEFGDLRSDDGTSLGSHYNPEGHDHGLPQASPMRHAGDLGNLTADAKGVAHYEIVVDNMTLTGSMNPILGRGVVVHAGKDDGGQPVGNAGGRIAVGVIGVAKP